MTTFLSTQNISLFTVPAAWWLCMVPHVYAFLSYDRAIDTLNTLDAATSNTSNSPSTTSLQNTTTTTTTPKSPHPKFNPRHPRAFLSTLSTSPLPSVLKSRLSRAEAASLNGYENLGFYAAAVVAANISLIVVHANESVNFSQEVWFVNTQCLAYLATRCLFSWSYIEGWSGPGRGVWFYAGLFCATRLYWRAGDGLRRLIK
jgi:uncharacterized MAPEG superfamily protein